MIHKVLMFGSRDWTNRGVIRRELRKLIEKHGTKDLVIIEGKARGADTISGELAKERNVHVVEVGALWDTRYNSAGPQRNAIMAALEPHEAIGFHPDINASKGSADMKRKCEAHKIPVRIVTGR